MNYYRADLPPNPIEVLLNKLDAAEAQDFTSADDHPSPDIPTLEHFLAEEDVLRECRSENTKLIKYICRPHVIRELVERSFDVPTLPADPPEPNGRASSDPSSSAPQQIQHDQSSQHDRERRMKYAYVASELLTTDNTSISDAVVQDDAAMKRIFSFLQQSESGNLNSIVAVQFSKIIVNLLKMKNPKVLEQMDKRGCTFFTNVLKHMDSLPIAELVVRLLDSPEPEAAYRPPSDKRPMDGALELLSRCDLLEGLAGCFVKASCGDISDPGSGINLQELHVAADTASVQEQVSDQEDAKRRRLREETMANVSMTILGLTERILQLPELGIRIPEKLSPYSSPAVVARVLDAGLYASCSGKPTKMSPVIDNSQDENARLVEAFSKGNTSALVHSLGLIADLLTTEANVVRDDDDDAPQSELVHGAGMSERTGGFGIGRAPYSGRGIGPSIAQANPISGKQNENGDITEKPTALPELLDKKAGDPIVETQLLEAELAIRFARLSEMFEEGDIFDEGGNTKPLGSLRLKLAEFFVACMKKSSQDTVDQINDLGVPRKLLELFAKYPWSSMLHGVVTKAIVHAFEDVEVGQPARQAWLKAGLIPWLMNSWAKNTESEDTERGSRAGYMGHLLRIGTALKGYIEENQDEPNADLPARSEMESFEVFGDQALAPAHTREATPLCEDRPDSDEGEDARDVLEMGGISIVEGLTPENVGRGSMSSKYAVLASDDVIDDDEEIKTVDVDDLAHFGADDDDVNSVQPIDHDIPPVMREELSRVKKDDTKKVSGRRPGEATSTAGYRPVEPLQYTRDDLAKHSEELKGVIDTVDSSSDEEGSYVAFVDDQRETENLRRMTEKLDGVKIDEAADSSLAGAVTEIEEPGPIGAIEPLVPSLASNVVSISDDDMNSSDEEYEAWEDATSPSASSITDPAPIPEVSKRSTGKNEASRKVG